MGKTIYDDYTDVELEGMVEDFIINVDNKNYDYIPKDKRLLFVLLGLSINYPGILRKGHDGWIVKNCIQQERKYIQQYELNKI